MLEGFLEVGAVLEGLKDSLALPDIPEDEDGARWEIPSSEGFLVREFSYWRDPLCRMYSETCMALFSEEPILRISGDSNMR